VRHRIGLTIGFVAFSLPSLVLAESNLSPEEAIRMYRMQAEARQIEDDMKNPKQAAMPADRAVLGDRKAPIHIVEYSDFQCPYCARGFQSVEEIRKRYGKKVMFMFKHQPLPMHPMALPAAQQFEAIAMQSPKKAYAFHDCLFKSQERLATEGEKFLEACAKSAGANLAKMRQDAKSDKVRQRIEADTAEAKSFGLNGTPGFIVAGVRLSGAYPADIFAKIIDQKLKPAPRDAASKQ
jgi:protein-disulfide isomerase